MSKISYPQLVKDVADAVRIATDTTDLIKVGDLANIISELGAKMGDIDFWYKSITYNEDDTITLIDQNDVEHTIVCTYDGGKIVKVTYDGAKLELEYNKNKLVQVGDTEIDLEKFPESNSVSAGTFVKVTGSVSILHPVGISGNATINSGKVSTQGIVEITG